VAISFDPFTTTWTKFLHGEAGCDSSQTSIFRLLHESEKELAKLLLANGNMVPYQGNVVQTVSLRREQQKDTSAGSSLGSGIVCITTPESILSDTVRVECFHEEHPVEVAASEEPQVDETPVEALEPLCDGPEPASEVLDYIPDEPEYIPAELEDIPAEPEDILPEPESISQDTETTNFGWGTLAISKKDKKKRKERFTFNEMPVAEEYPTDVLTEEAPAEITAEEDGYEWGHPTEVDCSVIDIIEEIPPACNLQVDVPNIEDDYIPTSKKDKKKKRSKMRCGFQEIQAVEEYPDDTLDRGPTAEFIVEDIATASDLSSAIDWSTHDGIEEVRVCEPEAVATPLEDYHAWECPVAKKDKKKKGRVLVDEDILTSMAEHELALPPAENSWDFISAPKSKKKKKSEAACPEPVLETILEPETVPAAVSEWDTFSAPKAKKKGKKGKLVFEEEIHPPPEPVLEPEPKEVEEETSFSPEPVPEPEPEAVDDWSFSSATKGKKRQGKMAIEEEEILPLEPEPVVEFEELRLDVPPYSPSPVRLRRPSKYQPRIEDGVWKITRPESPPRPEPTKHSTPSSLLTSEAVTEQVRARKMFLPRLL